MREIKSKTITIVSGLPRSGTSMMMQMLTAGGVEPLTDDKRKPDTDNPKGYLEYIPARKLDKDDSWIPKACGKVVKIVAQLLPYLPDGYNYKIILMRRDMEEILKSQQVMLKEEDKKVDEIVKKIFKRDIQKAQELSAKRDDIEMIEVWYKDVLDDTKTEVERIVDFLQIEMDKGKMNEAVDPSLHRNKKADLDS